MSVTDLKISVIAVTARMGCFDVLVNGLEAQLFPKRDYEVIIVDTCFEKRPDMKARLPSNYIHVEPPSKYDYYDACFCNNFGLSLARGELIVHFSDLNWPDEHFLSDHWAIYQNFPGYSMTGFCDRLPVPELKESLTWENCAWSIFKEEMTAEVAQRYIGATEPEYRERKGGEENLWPSGLRYPELNPEKFYGSLNESIPIAVLREIDGWDEIYDGTYGDADIDLGFRARAAGWRFLVKPDSINRKFGTKATVKVPGEGKPEVRGRENYNRIFLPRKNEIIQTGNYRAKIGWSSNERSE